MCFIKSILKPVKSYHSIGSNDFQNNYIKPVENSYETVYSKKQSQQNNLNKKISINKYENLLLNLMTASLGRNSSSIGYLDSKISQCQDVLDDLLDEMKQSQIQDNQEQKSLKQLNTQLFLHDDVTPLKEEYSDNQLTNKLFGQRKYKYKLSSQDEFPDVIYKQRNIKVGLTIKNLNGKIIKNSNIINLCFALADDNGNWINSNRVGDPMLKGKTEVELYQGEAEFNKIYTKDISRTFPNGRVNIVIYAKPSALIYGGLTSEYEEHIDQNSVEPFVIRDVVIKAKKKY